MDEQVPRRIKLEPVHTVLLPSLAQNWNRDNDLAARCEKLHHRIQRCALGRDVLERMLKDDEVELACQGMYIGLVNP